MTTETHTWRCFRDDGSDQYLDVKDCGRMTIRPSSGGGYTLKVNSELVEVFSTIEAAKLKADGLAASMLKAKADLAAWYAGWDVAPTKKRPADPNSAQESHRNASARQPDGHPRGRNA
jgi:hypothetical protein